MTADDYIKVVLGEKLKERIVTHNYKNRKNKNKKINMSEVCRVALERELSIRELS